MALPAELWPSDTKAFFGTNYSSSTGNWVDDMGIASNLTQATSGSRPTEDTTTAPSGRKILQSDATKWLNAGGQIPTGSLASWATGKWVEFLILKLNALQDDDFYRFLDYSNSGVEDYFLHFFGKLWRWGLQSDANLDLTVARIIFVADAAAGTGKLYINGSAQSGTASVPSGMRTQWTGTKSVFATSGGTEGSNCGIGCHGYIQRGTFGSTEIAALDAAMSEWWSTAPGGGGTTLTLAAPAAEQRRSTLIVVPDNLLILPRGLAEERRAELAAARVSALAVSRAEERSAEFVTARGLAVSTPRAENAPAALTTLATYQASLATPKAEEAAAPATALSSYSVNLSGVGSSPLVPSPTALASNDVALPTAACLAPGAPVTVIPGAVSVALAAILNRETSGTVTVLVGGGAPQGVVFAAPGATELRSTVATSTTYDALLPVAVTAEQRSIITSLAAYVVALGPPGSEARTPPLASQAAYSVALSAPSVEQRAAVIAASASYVALFAALAPEERRSSVSQASTYGVAIAPAASTQATSFVSAGEFINVTCTFVGVQSSGSVAPITALASTPHPASIAWSFRPATDIVVSFRRTTNIRINQQQAATQITVVHRMILHVGDVNDIDFEFRDSHTKVLVDPSTVQLVVTSPSGAVSTYTYGSSANLTKLEVGKYRCAVQCTEPEQWSFAIVSPGPTAQGVETGTFEVLR